MEPNPITVLRHRNGVSQADLADALDLPLRIVRALEMNGRTAPPQALDFIESRIVRWRAAAPIQLPPPSPLPPLRLLDDEEGGLDA